MPKAFDNWKKVYKHFNAWSAAGHWINIFKLLMVGSDIDQVFIGGSYAKAHQRRAGSASRSDKGIGKRRGRIERQDAKVVIPGKRNSVKDLHRIKDGRAPIRTVLYMAILYNPVMKKLYKKLVEQGKHKKLHLRPACEK